MDVTLPDGSTAANQLRGCAGTRAVYPQHAGRRGMCSSGNAGDRCGRGRDAADEGAPGDLRTAGNTDGFTVISKADLVSEAQLEQVYGADQRVPGRHVSRWRREPNYRGERTQWSGLAEIRAELASCSSSRGCGIARGRCALPIDRVFVKKGFGTVVTGTLLSGEIRVGQEPDSAAGCAECARAGIADARRIRRDGAGWIAHGGESVRCRCGGGSRAVRRS